MALSKTQIDRVTSRLNSIKTDKLSKNLKAVPTLTYFDRLNYFNDGNVEPYNDYGNLKLKFPLHDALVTKANEDNKTITDNISSEYNTVLDQILFQDNPDIVSILENYRNS